mmetsp:Transcript_71716/g.153284  ORF Transcript_71716/g.153284 Transcript_71716/m.153284 type:complete len:280 (+) Transcript_71716:4334-5173(+)
MSSSGIFSNQRSWSSSSAASMAFEASLAMRTTRASWSSLELPLRPRMALSLLMLRVFVLLRCLLLERGLPASPRRTSGWERSLCIRRRVPTANSAITAKFSQTSFSSSAAASPSTGAGAAAWLSASPSATAVGGAAPTYLSGSMSSGFDFGPGGTHSAGDGPAMSNALRAAISTDCKSWSAFLALAKAAARVNLPKSFFRIPKASARRSLFSASFTSHSSGSGGSSPVAKPSAGTVESSVAVVSPSTGPAVAPKVAPSAESSGMLICWRSKNLKWVMSW